MSLRKSSAAVMTALALFLTAGVAVAQNDALPTVLQKAAARWKVDPQNVTISLVSLENAGVLGADGRAAEPQKVYSFHADRLIPPASTAKLVTTLAGLELLGGSWRWTTGLWADARPDKSGRIRTLYIRGGGDPALVIEKFALLLDRLTQLGVKHIAGNIVVDRSYFDLPTGDPSAFDGRTDRPYNQFPDAALVNWRNLSFDFVPEPDGKTARVITVPKLAGVKTPSVIALKAKGGCGDWKSAIGYRLVKRADGSREVRFEGALPKACGEKNFNVIAFSENEYLERLIRSLWVKDGRTWKGRVLSGSIPETAERLTVHYSPALPEVTTLVNKWSNNQIARHIFLTLGTLRVRAEEEAKAAKAATAENTPKARSAAGRSDPKAVFPRGVTLDDARSVLADWLREKGIDPNTIYLDNGSGLSRKTRASASAMTSLLAAGWTSDYRSELTASLPMAGIDGTMSRRKVAVGRAHLKTGYLSDVRSVGGYVRGDDGRTYALFASVHGEESMPGGIAFLNSVILWAHERRARK